MPEVPLRFRPHWTWTLLTIAAMAAFVALGNWQWQRGVARQAVWDAFADTDVPAQSAVDDELAGLAPFTRVRVQGSWDTGRQFLLDNISHGGAPGYNVLSLLRLAGGATLVVNRGWVPFSGYRDRLPDVALPEGASAVLTGRLSTLPAAGLAAGRQPPATSGPWPRITSFPTLEELERAAGTPLLRRVLLLDRDSADGYLREWRPPGIPPDRHFSYAVQWWMFAAAAFGLFLALNVKVVR